MKLILASASPRRKEILADLGYPFQSITADVQESSTEEYGLEHLATYNAKLKAEAVYKSLPVDEDFAVIGSDTVVWLEGKAYGKPKNQEDSHRILTELQGKTHQVGTGVSILSAQGVTTYCEVAHVTFHPLTSSEISAYIQDIPVSDKAGSYAIQNGGDRIIDHYEGEFSCIMGLPKASLKKALSTYPILAHC